MRVSQLRKKLLNTCYDKYPPPPDCALKFFLQCPYLLCFRIHALQDKMNSEHAASHEYWITDVISSKTAAFIPTAKIHKGLK